VSAQDVADGAATFDRIGRTCDYLAALGYPEVGHAIAEATRQRRGRVKAHVCPRKLADGLLVLAEEADRLAAAVSPAPRLCYARSPDGVCCEWTYRHDGPHDWEPRTAELARG
jgi:hypothetical protein